MINYVLRFCTENFEKGGQEGAMEAKHDTISKLKSFEALFRQGYKSQVIDQALNKLVGLEMAKTKRELNEIEARISDFEIKYNMQSQDFIEKFHAGSVDDSADFMEWISFTDMQSAIIDKIHSSIRDIGKGKQRNRYE